MPRALYIYHADYIKPKTENEASGRSTTRTTTSTTTECVDFLDLQGLFLSFYV